MASDAESLDRDVSVRIRKPRNEQDITAVVEENSTGQSGKPVYDRIVSPDSSDDAQSEDGEPRATRPPYDTQPEAVGMSEKSGTELAALYAKASREVVAKEDWFRTEPLTRKEKQKVESHIGRGRVLELHPGKVLIGRLRKEKRSDVMVWAAIRKLTQRATTHESRRKPRLWQIFLFNDADYTEMQIPDSLDGDIQPEQIFKRLSRNDYEIKEGTRWRQKVATCVRVALIDSGLQNADDFIYTPRLSPDKLAKSLRKATADRNRWISREGPSIENTNASQVQPPPPPNTLLLPTFASLHERDDDEVRLIRTRAAVKRTSTVPNSAPVSNIIDDVQMVVLTNVDSLRPGGLANSYELSAKALGKRPISQDRTLRFGEKKQKTSHAKIVSSYGEPYEDALVPAAQLNSSSSATSRHSSVGPLPSPFFQAVHAPLEANIRTLTTMNELLQERSQRLDEEQAELSQENETLVATVNEQNEQLASIAQQRGELITQVDLLKRTNDVLKVSNSELRNQVESLSSRIDMLNSEADSDQVHLPHHTNDAAKKNEDLVKMNEDLVKQNKILMERMKELGSLRQKVKTLEAVKEAHVQHCEPVMLDHLTSKHAVDGSDSQLATLDARMEYVEMFGFEAAEPKEE